MAKKIKAAAKKFSNIIADAVPVSITAAEGEGKGPAKFSVTAYTGGALNVSGWDRPVVIDVNGLAFARSVVANFNHDSERMVGHVTDKNKTDSAVELSGVFSVNGADRDKVVGSAGDGFPWEASVEVSPGKVDEVEAGKTVKVNGQEFAGPLYVARKGTLTGFGFVAHGADQNTTVSIAATKAASHKEPKMNEIVKAWFAKMCPSVDVETLSAAEVAAIEAQHAGLNPEPPKPQKSGEKESPFETRKLEAKRREEIQAISEKAIDRRKVDGYISEEDISAIEEMHDHAIESGMTPVEFRCEINEAMLPVARTVRSPDRETQGISAEVIEAAICVHGRLSDVEKQYGDKTLQAAHDRFKHGIGLGEVLMIAAQAGGYKARPGEGVTDGNLKAILSHIFAQPVRGSGAFSTFTLPVSLSNVANKFVREGWNYVDQSWREISTIRSVNNFQEITTVSLVDGLMFQPLAPNGEIKHGTVSETTYGNKADTYARMFVVDRRDIINDDLNILSAVPQKLGRGSALKLNDLFWAEWLNPTTANFWHTNNANVNTGVATMTIAGLTATEIIFKAQTGPDGNLLGSMPRILLVPPSQVALARTLMASQFLIDGTASATQGSANIYQGRFKVVESSYLADTQYTGNDANAWYMLADPMDIPAIEVVALNGRVEPVIDTAEADFNVLGFQMRGYADVGVRVQEPRAGVRADGGAS